MAFITESAILSRRRVAKSFNDIYENMLTAASDSETYDVFLSYSSDDLEYVIATKEYLEEFGLRIYANHIEDPNGRSKVTPKVAEILRKRMKQCASLVLLHSKNSGDSKWVPWELGYFDALKNRVAILPIVPDDNPKFEGQEYLSLYPYLDEDTLKGQAQRALFINKSEREYGTFRRWLVDGSGIKKR